jgi:hypothetical protein
MLDVALPGMPAESAVTADDANAVPTQPRPCAQVQAESQFVDLGADSLDTVRT